MITFEEAQAHIFALPFTPIIETISILDGHQRIVATDTLAPAPLPAWNNSAMDGYALHVDDIDNTNGLPVTQIIPAGATTLSPLQRGTCARIFTGAPVPEGANRVVMQENTSIIDGCIHFQTDPKPWKNIRREGEEINTGTILLKQGTVLDAAAIALAIGAGLREVSVWKQPTIGVLGTGDELVDPKSAGNDKTLQLGQIWGTNTIALQLALKELGCPSVDCGIARDNLESTIATFQHAIVSQQCDIIISTGGVSVGDFDVVHTALAELPDCTVEMNFWKVRMKPGKPVAAGVIQYQGRSIPLFALPGNPVSALMGFYQFVRPFLLRHWNHPSPDLPTMDVKMGVDIYKRGNRLEFIRCWLKRDCDELVVLPTPNQSSAWMSSFADATALLPIPPECNHIAAGETVTVQLLPNAGKWPATWRQ